MIFFGDSAVRGWPGHACGSLKSIAQILPPEVHIEEQFGTLGGGLYENEFSLVQNAVPKRRREFAAGRTCARRALMRIGWPSQPILQGPARNPLWPPSVVGSITHCDNYCAAAVALESNLIALGVDAELDAPLPNDVLELIARKQEIQQLSALQTKRNWGRVLFSAKEAVYKAWYPLTASWLDFKDVELSISERDERFEAIITIGKNQYSLITGRYCFAFPFLLTSVALPTDPPLLS